MGVGCQKEIIQILADRLHCTQGRLPFQYLGLPIGVNPRSLLMGDPVAVIKKLDCILWNFQ